MTKTRGEAGNAFIKRDWQHFGEEHFIFQKA